MPGQSSEARAALLELDEKVRARIRHLEITKGLNLDGSTTIRAGAFGDILKFRCNIKNHGEIQVAGKRLRFHVNTEEFKRVFEQEIYVWVKLDHHLILSLLGYGFDKDGFPITISEWMDNGSIDAYMAKSPNLSFRSIFDIARNVSSGMVYLHENGVIHSDIKPYNIVINSEGKALICDFGASRMLTPSLTLAKLTQSEKGTVHFWAPELLHPEGTGHTKKTDVWAFGMTIYYLLTKKIPFSGYTQVQVIATLLKYQFAELNSVPGEKIVFPEIAEQSDIYDVVDRDNAKYQCIRRIFLRCTDKNPDNRPEMADIKKALKDVTELPPPVPTHNSPSNRNRAPTQVNSEAWRRTFDDADLDKSGAISPKELQAAFVNGDGTQFDIDTIKMLMRIFDHNRDGILQFREFCLLCKYIEDWKGIFQKADKDSSGLIDRNELSRILRKRFTPEFDQDTIRLIERKYALPPSDDSEQATGIPLDRFIRACSAVQKLIRLFEEKGADIGGKVTLSFEQFIQMNMRIP